MRKVFFYIFSLLFVSLLFVSLFSFSDNIQTSAFITISFLVVAIICLFIAFDLEKVEYHY
jgi:hypothetical protein